MTLGVDNNPHVCYNGIKIKRKELVKMDARLYVLLADHIREELKEFDIHPNVNDMNGIVENILEDIDERIIQYRDVVNKE